MKRIFAVVIVLVVVAITLAQTGARMRAHTALPPGYWSVDQSKPIVDKTQTITLRPELSRLSEGERTAVSKLLVVGRIFQGLYEQQRHAQAQSSYRALLKIDEQMQSAAETQNLLTLYRLFQGPIATTLESKREPFLPV